VKRAFAGLLAAGAVAAAAGAATAPLAGAALPEGRAYELVSPLESRGLDYDYTWTMPGGDRALMYSFNDTIGLRIATRGDGGWSTQRVALDPPGSNPTMPPRPVDAADDASRIAVEAAPLGSNVTDEVWTSSVADGSWQFVGERVRYAGASTDLGTVVVVPASASETPYPELGSGSGVFRWEDGAVESIGDDARRVAVCGATVADGLGARSYDQSGVSADGRTVVLTNATGGADCTDPDTGGRYLPHVLVWRDGETVDVSAAVDPATDAAATYVGNSADGSAVFFTTAAKLVQDDANGVADLYRYDVEQGALRRVSAAATYDGAAVKAAISADEGGAAWFVTALSTEHDALWSWTDGARPRLVSAAATGSFDLRPQVTATSEQTQLTPDGRVLVWMTRARIGGHRGSSNTLVRAAADGDVVCVSCTPTGASGSGGFGNPKDGLKVPLSRVSADGGTVIFETGVSLVPEDPGGSDVYAWHDGTRSMISSGEANGDIELGGISRDGHILFKDSAKLLPWIEDEHVKVYMARVGGGFPAPPAPQPTCAEDACQGAPGRLPEATVPGSETHSAPDDTDAPEQPWAADPAVRGGKVSARAKRRLAYGRAVALAVRATAPGRVSATVSVRIGKRWVRAGGAARTLRAAGRTTLSVRLGRQARRTLARRGALRVRIVVGHAAGVRDLSTTFVLKQKTAGRGR
jgi:hypothetical protein